jgi:RNA polymerase sigma-70 factor (ECF subfamily)
MAPPPPSAHAAAKLVDLELIQRLAAGEPQALGELYDRHAPMLLGITKRILGSYEDAEEVVQEVFVQIWNQSRRYDASRSSVVTWLVLMVRSRAIDRLRSRKVVDRTLSTVQSENRDAHTSAAGFTDVFSQERRQRVQHELAQLPEEQRRVIALAFFQGLTQSEIAAETGIPLGTVKTRTLLAMKKLRTALREEIRELL